MKENTFSGLLPGRTYQISVVVKTTDSESSAITKDIVTSECITTLICHDVNL